MEVLSHDNRNSHSFSLDGHEFGPIWPFVDQSSPYLVGTYGSDSSCNSVFRSTISLHYITFISLVVLRSNLEMFAKKSQNGVDENYVFRPQNQMRTFCAPKGTHQVGKFGAIPPTDLDDISQSTPDFRPIFEFQALTNCWGQTHPQ